MLTTIRSTWALFLGIALIMLGNGLQGTLLGVRASLEGFSTTTTGLVMTGYFVGFLFGSTLVPRFVRNVGHIRVFAALASLASISVLVHAVFLDPWLWMAMRVLTGFSYAGLYIVAESWLNERASNETRGRLLSVYMIVTLSAMAGGQLLLNLSTPDSFKLFVLISILVSISLVPISLSIVATPVLQATERVNLIDLYRASPLGIVGAFANGTATGTLFGMGAVYATQQGMPVSEVSLFMLSPIVGGIVLQWPIGWLSDRFDRRRVLTVVTFSAALTALAIVLLTGGKPGFALWLLAGLFGGMLLPLYSLCIAHTNDHLSAEQMVAASGSLVLVNGLGAVLGPLSASLIMQSFGANGFFCWLAAILGGLGVFALYRITRRPALPLEDQGAYVPVTSRYSPVAVEWAAKEAVAQSEEEVH